MKRISIKRIVVNEERAVASNENFNNLLAVVNYIHTKQIDISKRVEMIEDKVLDKKYGLNKIFYNGQFYDAYTLIQQIFESADREIIIIDNYVDRSILDRLVVKKHNVNVIIHTNINTSRILGKDEVSFNKQYGGLTIKYITKVHDRYIIVDQNKLYHLGHSIKDLGKKICSINELENNLIKTLLNNL